jgi:hypothetical protein
MSKALTTTHQNRKGETNLVVDRSDASARNPDFPSYFGNFGIFKLLLMFLGEAQPSKRHLGEKRELPLITAFMAIV